MKPSTATCAPQLRAEGGQRLFSVTVRPTRPGHRRAAGERNEASGGTTQNCVHHTLTASRRRLLAATTPRLKQLYIMPTRARLFICFWYGLSEHTATAVEMGGWIPATAGLRALEVSVAWGTHELSLAEVSSARSRDELGLADMGLADMALQVCSLA